MKKIFVFLVALTLALSFVPGVLALAVDNVYSNNFETQSLGWYTPWNGSISLTTEEAYNGSKSLKISNRVTSWDSPSINFYDYIKNTGPGQYQLSAYIMTDALSENNIDNFTRLLLRGESGFSFMNNYGVNYYCAVTPASRLQEGEWTHFFGTFEVKSADILADTGLIYFAIDLLAPVEGQNVYFDDITLTRTIAYHETFAVIPKEMVLDVGDHDYLSTNESSATYTSNNTSVATVDRYGKVTAISPGMATITAEYNLQKSYCTVFVKTIPDGTYFIQNAGLKKYIENISNNVQIQSSTFNAIDENKWIISYLGNNYYSIASYANNNYITVNDASGINQNLTLSPFSNANEQFWKITPLYGNYKLHAKSASSSNYDLCMTADSSRNVKQQIFTDDANKNDLWTITSLPTSGYEVQYNPSLWNYSPVKENTNCYSYALNNQLIDGSIDLMHPGAFCNEFVGANEMYEEFIIPAIQGDAEALDFTFEEIGKYSICSDGNYKVAIALSNTSFHWYRQNPDGTWSHKPGNNNVTKYDAANRIIYDPEVANRNYSDVNYNRFIGFFEVSPLNNMY